MAGSLYFSETRLQVDGEVLRGQELVRVGGEAWLDREIFTSTLGDDQRGWDWLSLQLDDGRAVGLVTAGDILRSQSEHPLRLVRDIQRAVDPDSVRAMMALTSR